MCIGCTSVFWAWDAVQLLDLALLSPQCSFVSFQCSLLPKSHTFTPWMPFNIFNPTVAVFTLKITKFCCMRLHLSRVLSKKKSPESLSFPKIYQVFSIYQMFSHGFPKFFHHFPAVFCRAARLPRPRSCRTGTPRRCEPRGGAELRAAGSCGGI